MAKKYRRTPAGIIEAQFQNDDWIKALTLGPDGKPDGRSAENIALAIASAPAWRDVLSYDAFNLVVLLHRPVPQSAKLPPASAGGFPRPMIDDDALAALTWFHSLAMVKATKMAVYDAMVAAARRGPLHPVLNFFNEVCVGDAPAEVCSKINDRRIMPALSGLTLSLLLTKGFGCKDTALHRAMSRAFMISMVRRIRQPGCQHDSMLVLIGKQGTRKSSGLRALVGTQWFTDEMPMPGTKDAALQLHGRVLVEWGEMAAFKGAEAERVKAFITRRVDRFRQPYGRAAEDHPRTCSFAGTSNIEEFLDDTTGGRRYWPVICGAVDVEWIAVSRTLLWRQACEAEAAGEPGWIVAADLQDELRDEQAELQKPDAWDDALAKFFEVAPDGITTSDVLARVGVALQDRTRLHEMRAADALRRHGWEHWDRPRSRAGVKRPRRWRRKSAER